MRGIIFSKILPTKADVHSRGTFCTHSNIPLSISRSHPDLVRLWQIRGMNSPENPSSESRHTAE